MTEHRRRGRPRLPIEVHLLRGTFRRDRHGERPKSSAMPFRAPNVPAAAVVPTSTGAELVEAIRGTWQVNDPVAEEHLRTIAIAADRRRAIDLALDGEGGALRQMATGQLSATAVATLLKAQQQSIDQLSAAFTALDLEPASASARQAS